MENEKKLAELVRAELADHTAGLEIAMDKADIEYHKAKAAYYAAKNAERVFERAVKKAADAERGACVDDNCRTCEEQQ